MSRYIVAAARTLGIAGHPFDAVLAGSMTVGEDWPTVVRIREALRAALPEARVTVSTALPVLGAALAGLAFLAPAEDARERVRAQLVMNQLHVVGGAAYLNFPGQ